MKKRILIIIFLSIFFVGTVGTFIVINNSHNLNNENTTELTGTVTKIQLTIDENSSSAEIYVEEYECFLYLNSNICNRIDLNDIQNLENGDTVIFRIENSQQDTLTIGNGFCPIVSLSTEHKDILSLNEYNNCMKAASLPAKIASVAVSIILLLADIYNIVLLKKRKTN